MSRSYKHTPRCGERKNEFLKRYANHVVRRRKLSEEFPQYSGYKRMYESWDICDYETVGETFEQYYAAMVSLWYNWRYLPRSEPFPDREAVRKEYEKCYIRK